MFGRRWPLAEAWIDVTLTCPNGPEGEDLGAVILCDIGNGDGIRVDIHSDIECARLLHS